MHYQHLQLHSSIPTISELDILHGSNLVIFFQKKNIWFALITLSKVKKLTVCYELRGNIYIYVYIYIITVDFIQYANIFIWLTTI